MSIPDIKPFKSIGLKHNKWLKIRLGNNIIHHPKKHTASTIIIKTNIAKRKAKVYD